MPVSGSMVISEYCRLILDAGNCGQINIPEHANQILDYHVVETVALQAKKWQTSTEQIRDRPSCHHEPVGIIYLQQKLLAHVLLTFTQNDRCCKCVA